MWICEHCSQSNSDNSYACSNCGKPKVLPEQSNTNANGVMPQTRRSSIVVPLLLSILLIAAVGFVWLLNKGILIFNIPSNGNDNSDLQVEVTQDDQTIKQDSDLWSAQAVARGFGSNRLLAAGSQFTIGIKADGSCIATGRDYPDVSGWTNMKSISAFEYTVAGLRNDGTVLCTDDSLDVRAWDNIIQIDFFSEVFEEDRHIVGLVSNGTAVSAGTNNYGECDVASWTGVIDVAAGSTHTVALLEDGTVVACGNNEYGQCNVSDWRRIVDVDASRYATYGLTADGSVLVAGFYENEYGSYVPEVPPWDNIVAIIASNETGNANDFVVGICSDGTIVSNRTGYLSEGELESFSDVQSIAVASWGYTICSDSQGNVRDVGWDVDGTRKVQSWQIKAQNIFQYPLSYDTIANEGEPVQGYYSDEWVSLPTFTSWVVHPFVFNTPLDNCKGFYFYLVFDEYSNGSPYGNWEFFVRDANNNWISVGTQAVDSDESIKIVSFDSPTTITAVAADRLSNSPCDLYFGYRIENVITAG